MDTGTPLRRCLVRRRASATSTVAAASSYSKRMRMSKEYNSCCEDMISRLPDDMLNMILDKLDARTATATTILSKRWRDLPRRMHTCYDLAFDGILPPRYHRLKERYMDAKAEYDAENKSKKLTDIYAFKDQHERFYAMKDRHERWMGKVRVLTSILQRYERWAMRLYVKRVNAFLLPPKNVHQMRSVQKLRLQTFGSRSRNCINQWITAAIARWGVEDLELVVDNCCSRYDFRLLDECRNVRLKRLVLSNCYPSGASKSLTFQRLTKLTLCNSDVGDSCEILRNCVQLLDFRLKHSRVRRAIFPIDVSTSKLKNLQVDNCKFGKIHLISLPSLETFHCRGQPTKLHYGEVPQLRHVSLDFLHTGDNGDDNSAGSKRAYPMSKFFKGTLPLECLFLQLKGPQIWVEPIVIPSPLSHLTKLFVANVPVDWDIFWILVLLDATPALESLHVHIDNSSEKIRAGQDVQVKHCQYHHLKELVFVGFDGTGNQTGFVKQIMRSSLRLRLVHLLEGHLVEDDEHKLGDLEIMPHRREWHERERSELLNDLTNGICLQYLDIVLE